jgi:tight adherence protein B
MLMLLTGLSAAVAVYFAVGMLVGYTPERLRFAPLAEQPGRAARARRQEWLNQAGVPVTPLQFWTSSIVAGAGTFLLVWLITSVPLIALAPAVAVSLIPRFYFAQQRRKLARARLEAWPEALRSIVAAVSSSLSLHQALLALATSGPSQLRPVFARYSSLSFTLDSATALEVVREELADPVSDRVIEDLLLALEQGPAVVIDIMADLSRSTVEDLQVLERVETAQLEQRLNARAVFVLPFLFLILLTFQPGPGRDFYSSPAGVVVILLGTGLSLVGMLIVRSLSRLPEEPRVFAVDRGERR